MKIIAKTHKQQPSTHETPDRDFNNGDIYINRRRYQQGERESIWMYSCGMLIPIVEGDVQYNAAGFERCNFINVTTKYTLIQNDFLPNVHECPSEEEDAGSVYPTWLADVP